MLGTIIPEIILTNCQYAFLFLNIHVKAMGHIVAYDTQRLKAGLRMGQQRPRLACIFAQTDLDLCCMDVQDYLNLCILYICIC